MEVDMKICPQCGQEVKAIAKKCRYCGYWFEEPQSEQPQGDSAAGTDSAGPAGAGTASAAYQAPLQYDMSQRKISIEGVLAEGFTIGITNFVPIFVAVLLTVVTIWIPYLNVGTVIALQTLPIVLAKKQQQSFSGTFVFDAKYRQYMGEYFTLTGLKSLSLFPAFMFLIVPGIIISIGWSQALYLMLDKEIAPGEALIQSSKITQGYKGTIFLTSLILWLAIGVVFGIVMWILGLIDVGFITFIGFIALISVAAVVAIGVNAAIYKGLTK
jgi:hypothetical protein